jgi:type II secretory ATPase GspE/PulE/Tfp pilus assembly ATPase PilB-like protein
VILLGEIRDNETAEYAFKAGQTGHLVLTTLHTNNAHESLDRLGRMDIPTDIIATNTQAIMAQRLVRSSAKAAKSNTSSGLMRSDSPCMARTRCLAATAISSSIEQTQRLSGV